MSSGDSSSWQYATQAAVHTAASWLVNVCNSAFLQLVIGGVHPSCIALRLATVLTTRRYMQ